MNCLKIGHVPCAIFESRRVGSTGGMIGKGGKNMAEFEK